MTVDENRKFWKEYAWPQDGEEWSGDWGGAEAQWQWCIRPRIARWLPAGRILEIAFGHGRWTRFLAREAKIVTAVEISAECLDYCCKRFSSPNALPSEVLHNVDFSLCNGRTLDGISDGRIDFAFSFDSLVHAEADVIASYLREVARVLKPGGAAFLHHSNFGAYPGSPAQGGRVRDMTSDLFATLALVAGVPCLVQERITWGDGRELRDCLSTIWKGAASEHPVLYNDEFMIHANHVKNFGACYASRPAQR